MKDERTARRLMRMIEEILHTPFTGIGKPEPLRNLGPDVWSRRLTDADRITYEVHDEYIDFLQARYHY